MSKDFIDKDQVWRKMVSDLRELEGKSVSTGVIGSDAVKDNKGITMVDLAVIHEFGTRYIPQRSFIRQGWDANQTNIQKFADNVINSVFDMKSTLTALNRLGLTMRTGVLEQFSKSGDPTWSPNTPETIKAKKSDKPLIDEGLLRASISYVISKD